MPKLCTQVPRQGTRESKCQCAKEDLSEIQKQKEGAKKKLVVIEDTGQLRDSEKTGLSDDKLQVLFTEEETIKFQK